MYECERGHIVFTAMPLRFVGKKMDNACKIKCYAV